MFRSTVSAGSREAIESTPRKDLALVATRALTLDLSHWGTSLADDVCIASTCESVDHSRFFSLERRLSCYGATLGM